MRYSVELQTSRWKLILRKLESEKSRKMMSKSRRAGEQVCKIHGSMLSGPVAKSESRVIGNISNFLCENDAVSKSSWV